MCRAYLWYVPFTPRYTDEEREAIYRLLYEDGKSASEAVALAAQGVYDLPPFDIPRNSVRSIAHRVKLKKEGPAVPLSELPFDEVFDELSRRSLRVMERELGKYEQDLSAERLDVENFRWFLRAANELAGLLKAGRGKGLASAGTSPPSNGESSVWAELLEKSRAQAANGVTGS